MHETDRSVFYVKEEMRLTLSFHHDNVVINGKSCTHMAHNLLKMYLRLEAQIAPTGSQPYSLYSTRHFLVAMGQVAQYILLWVHFKYFFHK